MSRLIDADALAEKIVRLYDFALMATASPAYLFQRVMRALKEAPTIEALEKRPDDSDRINVVRCSECQYWNPPTYAEQEDGSTVGHCTAALNGQQTDAYWFCADGTRRANERA